MEHTLSQITNILNLSSTTNVVFSCSINNKGFHIHFGEQNKNSLNIPKNSTFWNIANDVYAKGSPEFFLNTSEIKHIFGI